MKWVLLILLMALMPVAVRASVRDQAEAAYARRTDLAQARQALDFFEQALVADPKDALLYGEASRAAWWVGEHATDRDDKLATFDLGAKWAQKGLTLNRDLPILHFWLGANWGSYGESKGVLKSLFLVKPIRREMAEVLRVDESYDGGGGWRVLGAVDYKVPGIAGGSKKRALEELQKALAFGPQNFFNHYYMAEYWWTVGNKEKAKAELAVLKGLTAPADSQPELEMMQKKGEVLAAKL